MRVRVVFCLVAVGLATGACDGPAGEAQGFVPGSDVDAVGGFPLEDSAAPQEDSSVAPDAVSDAPTGEVPVSVDTLGPEASEGDVQDTQVTSDATLDPLDAQPSQDVPAQVDVPVGPAAPASMNAGWIGGPCGSDADCDYDGGFCLTEAEGFPNGMCSKACTKYCPDQDGAITTFCVDPADTQATPDPLADGLCGMNCLYGPSPTGCRAGYQCVLMSRYGEPGTQKYSCMPGQGQGFELSACHEELVAEGVDWAPSFNPKASPADYPNFVCDIQDPVRVAGMMHDVAYRYGTVDAEAKSIFAACALAVSLSKTAKLLASNGVTDVLHWGVYNCRIIGGSDPPKLSQHGLANAIDIKALVNASGQMSVLTDWEKNTAMPTTDAGAFLKWFAETIFDMWLFNTVLTPDYNDVHADHFHVDLTEGSHYLK